MEEFRLWRMTWPEIADRIKDTDIVLIPVGSMEQHGYHMPLDTDVFISTRICELSAERCREEGVWVPVASPVNYGVSWYHMSFAGTVDIPQRLFIDYIVAIGKCLYRHGFKQLIWMNSHGGNSAALTVASNILHKDTGNRVYIARWRELAHDIIKDISTGGIHADQIETSVAQALGQRVEMDHATKEGFDRYQTLMKKGIPVSDIVKYDAHHKGAFAAVSMDYINEISESGVVGDATNASELLGKKVIDCVTEKVKKLCMDLDSKKK